MQDRFHRGSLTSASATEAPLELVVINPLGDHSIAVPRVLDDSLGGFARIAWVTDDLHESPPLSRCLASFAQLADGSDQAILRFATRWGPLGICEHGKPAAHADCEPLTVEHRSWEERPKQLAWSARLGRGDQEKPFGTFSTWRGAYWEPLAAWLSRVSPAC